MLRPDGLRCHALKLATQCKWSVNSYFEYSLIALMTKFTLKIGMMELNGSRHEITPVYNLEEPVGEIEMVGDDALMVQHELRPVKGQPERKCSSRSE